MRWLLCLYLFVASSGLSTKVATIPNCPITDWKYKKACGPIACYCALRAVDIKVSLNDVIKQCKWEPNKPAALQDMLNALESYGGVECQAIKLSPRKLVDILKYKNRPVILPIRKNSEIIDHAVVALQVDSDKVVTIGFPEMVTEMNMQTLCNQWDGQALIVSRRKGYLWKVVDHRFPILIALGLLLCSLFVFSGFRWWIQRTSATSPQEKIMIWPKRDKETNEKP